MNLRTHLAVYLMNLLPTSQLYNAVLNCLNCSVDRGERFQFNLGKQEVIKGWDRGVASMARGEVSNGSIVIQTDPKNRGEIAGKI